MVRSRLEWAVHIAQFGYPIIALKPGAKEPMDGYAWGVAATIDETAIRAMFDSNPDCNYGVCGGPEGVIVDTDCGIKNGREKQGDKQFANLEADQELDDFVSTTTLIIRSPTGGKHYYLKAPFPVANSHRFPSDIDVRGIRGYVVGPGCVLVAGKCKASDTVGTYTVENDAEPIRSPNWIVERLKRQGEKNEYKSDPVFELDTPIAIDRAKDFLRHRAPALEGQEGDKHTLLTAMGLIDLGISEEKAVELMTAPLVRTPQGFISWNDSCDPPWPYDELAVKVGNAWRYRERRPGDKGVGLMDQFEAQYGTILAEAGIENTSSKWERIRQHLFRAGALFKRNKDRDMTIPEWLPSHGVTALLGVRGSGKTIAMVDTALRLSLDMEWHGMTVK